MANFGFARLAVVAPYEEHWREAKSAVGASDLLQNAMRVESLAEAVAECTLVIGTGTLARRKPEQPVIPLPELTPRVDAELARGGRIALVFGPEKRGLTREDLAHCHMLVEIPTDARQPSMNLGQAVAVCLYELAARKDVTSRAESRETRKLPSIRPKTGKTTGRVTESDTPAAGRELERLAEVVEQTMLAANYSPEAMRAANRHDLNLLLRRLALTRRDARRILGLFRKVLWRLKHPYNTK